ncbi:MAG: hypothetical protein Q7S65_05985 [Nanoarchaeota archaeon]|nr:hypothetical protein [Nanoarchaeota archaeon]
MNVAEEAASLFHRAWRQKLFFLSSGLLEIGFLAAFLSVFFWAMQHVYLALRDLSTMTQALEFASGLEVQQSAYEALAQSAQFHALYQQLLFWAGMLALSVGLVLVLFQVILFYWSERMLGEKPSFWPFARRCAFILLSGFLSVVGVLALTVFLAIWNSYLVIPLFPQPLLVALVSLTAVLSFALSWFAIARIPQKKTFREAIKHAKNLLLSFLLSIVLLAIGAVLAYLFFRVGDAIFAALQGLPTLAMRLLFAVLALYFTALLLAVGMFLTLTRLFLLSRLRA